MKACFDSSSNRKGSYYAVLLAALLYVLSVKTTVASSIETERYHIKYPHRYLNNDDQIDDDDNNESLEDEFQTPHKYHPGKEDVHCENYPQYNRTQTQYGYGYGYGNGNGNGNGNQYGRPTENSTMMNPPPPPPCRDRPSSSSLNSGSGNDQPTREELLRSTVKLNISVALPKDYQDGIPNRLTTAVKKYLRQPSVTQAFRELDFNGVHFDLTVWKSPPRDEDSDEGDDDEGQRQLQASNNNINTSPLGLVALKDNKGHYIGDIPDTKYAWVRHTVYLVAHDGEESRGAPLIQDPDLMDWLRIQLQDIVYQDLRIEGPLEPYYDINNAFQHSENYHQRQISFLEWTLQEFGIPIRGIEPPGQEFWSIDDDQQNTASMSHHDERSFDHPISLSPVTTQQWMGLFCLVVTAVTTTTLALVASRIAKRREREELWGINMRMMESLAKEDADYLDVGWRFADHNQFGGDDEAPPPQKTLIMEVYDKRGVGYQEGNSLLMGGYEYKPKSNQSIVGGRSSFQ